MANRNIRCKDCLQTKWLSQKQWRVKLDKYGTPRKLKANYRCAKCKHLEKSDPLAYNMFFGKRTKDIRKCIQKSYRAFLLTRNDAVLHGEIMKVLEKNNLPSNEIFYHRSPDNKHLYAITVRGVSFIWDLVIPLYTPRQKSY